VHCHSQVVTCSGPAPAPLHHSTTVAPLTEPSKARRSQRTTVLQQRGVRGPQRPEHVLRSALVGTTPERVAPSGSTSLVAKEMNLPDFVNASGFTKSTAKGSV